MELNRYHWNPNNRVMKTLRNIEKDQGKLSSHTIKLCNEYAIEILGHKKYAYWLYVYSAIAGGFKEGWIPDRYFKDVVIPKIDGDYRALGKHKSLNNFFFNHNSFPDLASQMNGVFFNKNYKHVSPIDLKNLLFKEVDDIVFKEDSSMRGRGIHFFNRKNFDITKIKKLGNGIFQRKIDQHDLFKKFTDNSVATLRITTVTNNLGEASARASYLRLGSGSETYLQSESNIRIPIDIKSGDFSEIAYLANWRAISEYPISKLSFKGNTIPLFNQCIELVLDLHTKVPFIGLIGWDVTIDANDNIMIMEWNSGHTGITLTEATQGPCFADLGWEKLRN